MLPASRWYVNGSEVTQAAGKTTVKGEVDPSMVGGTFRVYAHRQL